MIHHGDSLTPREHEVLELFKKGLSNQEIAAALKCHISTVRQGHMSNIYRKLGIESDKHKTRRLMAKLFELAES